MKVVKKKVLSLMKFLNKPFNHEDASIMAQIEVLGGNRYGAYEITYKVRDCSKMVNLQFDLADEKAYRNALFKADTIVEVTQKFKEGLIEARKLIIENQKAEKENDKKKSGGGRRR